jgi:hypothetical protein
MGAFVPVSLAGADGIIRPIKGIKENRARGVGRMRQKVAESGVQTNTFTTPLWRVES